MTESMFKNDISQLIQQILPVLDALHTLPFSNEWLQDACGASYCQFLKQTETWLLWIWQQLQRRDTRQLSEEVKLWESQQHRKTNGVLQQYYRVYEALGTWAHQRVDHPLRGEGQWSNYIVYVLFTEPHFLKKLTKPPNSSRPEHLELVTQHYLQQMQIIYDLDPYSVAVELFTMLGTWTQKSYFVPYLEFETIERCMGLAAEHRELIQNLKESNDWAELAFDYLEVLQKIPSPNSP